MLQAKRLVEEIYVDDDERWWWWW